MSVPLTFMASRQNPASPTIVLWGGGGPATVSIVVLIASKRLNPEESEKALAGDLEGCSRLVFSADADAMRDDVSPAGEPRYYAVVSIDETGVSKPLRFRAGPMSQPPERTIDASTLLASFERHANESGNKPLPQSASASAPLQSEEEMAPAPVVDTEREVRRAAQRRAQTRAEARNGTLSDAKTTTKQPPPASDYPIRRFGLRMTGATQSWDGLRIQWEDEGREVEAFEIIVSDHPLEPDEVGTLLSGEDVSGATLQVVVPSVRTVIDNVTPREARAYCGVIARVPGGERFPVGSVAQSWDECRIGDAPFFKPDATTEVRELANGHVREARIQLMLWTEEQDVAVWREALRLVNEALVIFPQFGPALECKRDIEAARLL